MKYLPIIFAALLLVAMTSCASSKTEDVAETTRTERSQRGGQRGGPPSIDQIFEMDTDGNGMLSKSEVQGPLEEMFDTIDIDSDGYLTREEVENAPRPERPQRQRP